MSLVPKIEWIRDAKGERLYITDVTGVYDASTNTGGYGAPNQERGDLVIVPYVRYMHSSYGMTGQECSYDIEFNDTSNTELEIVASLINDGWYYIAWLWLPKTEVTENKVYFDTVNEKIMQVKSTGDIEISKQEVLDLDSQYQPLIVDVQEFMQPRLALYIDDLQHKKWLAYKDKDKKRYEELKYVHDLYKDQMISADYSYRVGLQVDAQEIVEDLLEGIEDVEV